MPIKNLTDQYRTSLQTGPRGRLLRLGVLHKGTRTEQPDGKTVLKDLDRFVYTAKGANPAAMESVFHQVYKPAEGPIRVIPDVRIPASIAGNYDIEDHAWLVASRHTKAGTLFLARSDGEWIVQARDPSTGHVKRFRQGELAHADLTQANEKGAACFDYGGRLYEWTQTLYMDLILPDLNEELFRRNLAGYGAVTLITRSTYDIAGLVLEYHAILDELAGLYADPTRAGSMETQRNHIPLRDVPLTLSRTLDPISTPGWGRDAEPGERRQGTRWLLHLQISPRFSQAMQEARDRRTAVLLEAIASGGQVLGSGQRPLLADRSLDEVNSALFGAGPALQPATGVDPETGEIQDREDQAAADWEEITQDYLGGTENGDQAGAIGSQEDDLPPWAQDQPEDQPADPRERALAATTRRAFCQAVLDGTRGQFGDLAEAERGYAYIWGNWNPDQAAVAWAAMIGYANAVADGMPRREAADKFREWARQATKANQGGNGGG